MVVVHQGGEPGLEGLLAQVPGRTPRQALIRQLRTMGHLIQAEVARLGQQARVEIR